MSKTKFTKVAVEERLPEEQGMYMVIFKNNKVGKFNFWNEEAFKDSWNEHVNYWLEESPDREDEMMEMLERAKTELYKADNLLASEIRELLQSLKQEK